jgi:hypothetical protein
MQNEEKDREKSFAGFKPNVTFNYHNSGHYPSCLSFKITMFRTGFCFRLQVKRIQMGQ